MCSSAARLLCGYSEKQWLKKSSTHLWHGSRQAMHSVNNNSDQPTISSLSRWVSNCRRNTNWRSEYTPYYTVPYWHCYDIGNAGTLINGLYCWVSYRTTGNRVHAINQSDCRIAFACTINQECRNPCVARVTESRVRVVIMRHSLNSESLPSSSAVLCRP